MNKIYTSRRLTVVLSPRGWDGPSINLTDSAPTSGTFVEVSMESDESTITQVMEGGGVVNLMPGTGGRITVTLVAAGDQNSALSDARRYQKKNGEPRAWSVMARDHSGGSLFSCPYAVIQGAPQASYSETIPTFVWVFLCPELDMDHRGSNNLG